MDDRASESLPDLTLQSYLRWESDRAPGNGPQLLHFERLHVLAPRLQVAISRGCAR